MAEINTDDRAILAAALLHDIGKPQARRINPKNNHVQFFGHEALSATLSEPILAHMVKEGLLSDSAAKEAHELVAQHGFFYRCKDVDEAYEAFVSRRDFFVKLSLLVECDHLGRFADASVETQYISIEQMITDFLKKHRKKTLFVYFLYYNTLIKQITQGDLMVRPICPKCHSSEFVIESRTGKKVGVGVGTVAGGAAGYTGAVGGAEAGAAIGSFLGPVGAIAGGAIGGLMGALAGASVGGAVGYKVGDTIDEARMVYVCNKCHTEIQG